MVRFMDNKYCDYLKMYKLLKELKESKEKFIKKSNIEKQIEKIKKEK